jgi:uncharacterized alkaline shock family protein YloU
MFFEYWKILTNLTFYEAIEQPFYWYAILLLLVLFISLIAFRKFRKELIEVFHDEDGHVQITPNALHELVKKSCEGISGVFSPSTTIQRKRSAIRLNIRIRVQQNCNIKEIRSTLQKNIEKTLIENLSFTNFEGVDVIIKGFQEEA